MKSQEILNNKKIRAFSPNGIIGDKFSLCLITDDFDYYYVEVSAEDGKLKMTENYLEA
jgi:hypothetical protein